MSPCPPRVPRLSFEAQRRWLRRRRYLIWGLSLLLAGGIAFSLRYRLVGVVGNSMAPTFSTGDLLVVDLWTYRDRPPQRGEVVVARHRDEFLVKRVVGLPGEEVGVRLGRVEVNGLRQAAHHDFEPGLLDIAPGHLMSDRYALLGDNRGIEPSAFVHAIVSSQQILGPVTGAVRWSAIRRWR
jgi:signal peptidase I